MKKKVVSLLAAMALAVTALAGCGSNDAATTGTDAATVAATTEAAGTTEAATDSEAVTGVKAGFIFLHDENSTYDLNFLNAAKAACEKLGIEQRMSKAGYPYDNAPMERYFNTLKNDLIYQHYYRTQDELYTAVEEFAYVQYNHVRPHSYNNYKTPYEARHGVT